MAYHGVRFFSREAELCMTRIGNGLESTEWAERALQRMDETKRTCASCPGAYLHIRWRLDQIERVQD